MPAALKLLFRRTLATSAMNPPSSSPSSSLRYPHRNFLGVGWSRLAKGGAGGARLVRSVPGAHVNNKKKNIRLISNTNNILPNTTRKREQQQQQLYFLSPLQSSSSRLSSSSFSEEREKRVSSPHHHPHCLGREDMGVAVEDHKQNGVVSYDKDDDHHHHPEHECTKLLTLPTLLTLARVAAIPIFIATFYVNSRWGTAATTSIFVAAAITDWLDGYLARKMRQGTAFGAFLDPVADKLMVAATLVLLCSRPPETAIFGDIPWLFPVPAIAIIGREITMSAVREWAASQNTKILQAVAVNNLGKWKTATQMTALTILVATRDNSLGGSGTLVASGVALLYISAGLAVWSLVVYMRKISKVLLR